MNKIGKVTLEELGISEGDAEEWQKLAAMPEEVFEAMIGAIAEGKDPFKHCHKNRVGHPVAADCCG